MQALLDDELKKNYELPVLHRRIMNQARVSKVGAASVKMGDARVRQVLYLAAMSTARYNEGCRAFYVRLRQQAPFETRGTLSVSNYEIALEIQSS